MRLRGNELLEKNDGKGDDLRLPFFVTPPISDFTTFLIRKMNIKHNSTKKEAAQETASTRKNSMNVFLPLVYTEDIRIGR